MIIKILLWILLAILLFIVIIGFINVRITIDNRDGLAYRITVSGIPSKAETLLGGKKKDKKKKEAVKEKTQESKKKSKSVAKSGKSEPGLAVGTVLSLIMNIVKTGIGELPKCLRIRLKHLYINVGGSDAAQVAVNYGKVYAALCGALAFLDGYRGVFSGFRTKRKKIKINADFLAEKSTADFELTVSFFLWQLFFYNIKLEVSAITAIMESEGEA